MGRQSEPFTLKKRNSSPYFSFKLKGWTYYISCQSYYKKNIDSFDIQIDAKKKTDAMIVVQHAIAEREKKKKYLTAPRKRTLRDLMENAYVWDKCPHVTRLREEGESISERHVNDSRWVVQSFILPDPLMKKSIDIMKRADVLDFRSRLLKKVGPRTVNKALTILRTMIREAILREKIDRDPTMGIKKVVEKDRNEIGVFSVQELRALFPEEGIGPWRSLNAYAIFFLAMGTGMRRGELLALKWKKINFKDGYIVVDEAFKDASLTKIGPPKWDKIRVTPVPGKVLDKLEELKKRSWYTEPDDFVFCKPDGEHYGLQWGGLRKKSRIITPIIRLNT